MLLNIFIFLVVFSLILIIGGYYIEAPVMQVAGTAVLFVTGLLLMFSSVEYVSGEYYKYGNNFSYVNGSSNYHWDYATNTIPNKTDETVYLFHRVDEFSTWDDEEILGIKTRHTVAFLLLVSAVLIFISVLSQLREGLDDEG